MEFLFSIVGHRLTVAIKGVIDGNFKLGQEFYKMLKEHDYVSEVIFVLRKAEGIDKEGVAAWEKEIKNLADKNYTLTFIECPKNLLESLLKLDKNGTTRAIRSFMVPYYCASCNEEFPQLINTNSLSLSFSSYKKPNCPHCSKRLSLDITNDEIERISSFLPLTDAYSDKRKYPRFDVSAYGLKVHAVRKKDNVTHTFMVVNFSEAGICLSGRHYFDPFDIVELQFNYKGKHVVSDATVIWFSMEGDSTYMMGLSVWSKEIFNLLIKA